MTSTALKTKRKRHPRKLSIRHPVLKKHYDPKLTMRQNMTKLGLQIAPRLETDVKTREKVVTLTTLTPSDVETDILTAPPPAPPVKIMPEGERLFVQELVKKHGLNFGAMFRDMDLNEYQHTASVIRKKISKFIDLFPEEAVSIGLPDSSAKLPELD
ncbi:hypothetical protein GEMRC1_004946 [Eukaryota sp. GEM-RC1]